MRTQYKVVGILFGVQVLAWLVSAFFASLISGEAFSWGLFSIEAPAHITRILTISVITLIAAGIVMWRLLARRERAQKALRESEEKYRQIVDLSPDTIAIHSEGKIIFINSAGVKLLRADNREQILGKPIMDLLHRDYRQVVEQRIRGAIQDQIKASPVEEKFIRLDGTAVDVEVAAAPITWQGKPAIQAVARDITERKEAEDTLRKSEKQASAAIEAARAITFNYDIASGKVEWGGAIEEITGHTIEEFAEVDIDGWAERIHPDDRDEILSILQEAMGKDRATAEYRFKTKKGYITLASISLTEKQYGKAVRLVGILQDITEREEAEDALRESEERYRSLVEDALDIIYSVSPDGAITSLNPAFESITGWSRSEWIGKQFASLIHPDDMAPAMELFQSAVQEGIPGTLEARILAESGEYLHVEVGSTPQLRNERLAGFWGIARDITERKEAEERERQLQAELSHSRRLAAIGELAAGIAHEINNPLTGILGFSERLLRKSTDEEARRDLARVTNEAQRVSKIVENLLTFARRREPKKEHVDVNDILQRTLELRAYELKTSNIEVEVELASGLRKVMADFQRIQEVFLNLILNAEQAMSEAKEGGKLGIRTEGVKGGIRVSFADDGPGIKAENLDSLFDPFFTTRGERGGTGLGLSVCHGIVTEHGGRIYAESEEGKGATFFVELPVASRK